MIKNFGIQKLKEMRFLAKLCYNKLENWNLYSNKCENQALE